MLCLQFRGLNGTGRDVIVCGWVGDGLYDLIYLFQDDCTQTTHGPSMKPSALTASECFF